MRWLGTLPGLLRIAVAVIVLEVVTIASWCACRWPQKVVAVCTVLLTTAAVLGLTC